MLTYQKRVLFPVLFFLSVAMFYGCGRRADEIIDERVRLTFAHFGDLANMKVINKYIPLFEKENPDIDLVFVPVISEHKLLIMIAGGMPPDVFIVRPTMLTKFIDTGVLLNLSPHIEASKIVNVEDFFPAVIKPYRFDGERFGRGDIFGLCKDWGATGMVFYNKRLFDEARLEHPDPSWDWEEFLEIAKKLTKVDERGIVTQYGVNNNSDLEAWIIANGGTFFSEDGRKSLLDSKEAIEAVQFYVDLSMKHKVSPKPSGITTRVRSDAQDPIMMFLAERAAMIFFPRWFAALLPEHERINWGMLTPPLRKGQPRRLLSRGMVGYGISSKTNHLQESWRFMEFLLGPKGQKIRADFGLGIPSHIKIAESEYFLYNPEHPAGINRKFIDAAAYTQLIALSRYIARGRVDALLNGALGEIMFHRRPVKDVMIEVAEKINDEIEEGLRRRQRRQLRY